MERKLVQAGILALIAVLVCSIVLAEKCGGKKGLPAEVEKVVAERYPGALITESKKESEGFKVYEVELALTNGKEVELTLAPDGTIMEVEDEVNAADLPFDLSTVLPSGAEVKEIEREVIHAVLAPVALKQPKTVYELEVIVNGREVEIEVAADGTILSQEVEDEDDDDEDDDDEDDDDEDNGD